MRCTENIDELEKKNVRVFKKTKASVCYLK